MGRPSKLTQAVKTTVIDALESGLGPSQAAQLAGISSGTLSEWVRRGEGRDDRPASLEFAKFAKDVTRAIAASESALISRIHAATEKDWRAAAWLLERRWPDRWANTHRIEMRLQEELDAILDKLQASLDSELYERVLEILSDDD